MTITNGQFDGNLFWTALAKFSYSCLTFNAGTLCRKYCPMHSANKMSFWQTRTKLDIIGYQHSILRIMDRA